jgi:hypothetical protein
MNLRLRRVELHNLAGVLVHSVVAYQTVLERIVRQALGRANFIEVETLSAVGSAVREKIDERDLPPRLRDHTTLGVASSNCLASSCVSKLGAQAAWDCATPEIASVAPTNTLR